MPVIALLLAAGKGSRMQAKENKVFLPLMGQPVLVHSLRALEATESIDGIICVVREGEEGDAAACAKCAGCVKPVHIVTGGETRQQSVQNGLKALPEEADYVAIHDGARPLVAPENIESVISVAKNTGAAILAVPVKDTVKQVEGGSVVRTLNRNKLWAAQTPQVFRRDIIERAHREATQPATDDASMVETFHSVEVVIGSYCNVKITTPSDMQFAEAVLRRNEYL